MPERTPGPLHGPGVLNMVRRRDYGAVQADSLGAIDSTGALTDRRASDSVVVPELPLEPQAASAAVRVTTEAGV